MRANDGGSSRYHMILGKCCVDSAVGGAEDRQGNELEVPANRCS